MPKVQWTYPEDRSEPYHSFLIERAWYEECCWCSKALCDNASPRLWTCNAGSVVQRVHPHHWCAQHQVGEHFWNTVRQLEASRSRQREMLRWVRERLDDLSRGKLNVTSRNKIRTILNRLRWIPSETSPLHDCLRPLTGEGDET